MRFSIAILMVLLILGTFGLSLYSLTWPWMISKSTWGQLMEQYSIILNKIDVARGRCVPVPSKLMHSSSRLFSIPNSPLNMLHLRSSSKTSLERIVDALNPYTASPNIRLILDMIAYKSGLGIPVFFPIFFLHYFSQFIFQFIFSIYFFNLFLDFLPIFFFNFFFEFSATFPQFF